MSADGQGPAGPWAVASTASYDFIRGRALGTPEDLDMCDTCGCKSKKKP